MSLSRGGHFTTCHLDNMNSLEHRTIELSGQLIVDGRTVGSGTSASAPAAMFEHYSDPANSYSETAHSDSDYVQNPIGRVAADTTVAQLRARYANLDHLVSAMLNIAAVPENNPQPVNASISLSGQGDPTSMMVGTQISRTFTVTINRGSWNPHASATAGGAIDATLQPYGAVTSLSLTDPFQDNATVNLTVVGNAATSAALTWDVPSLHKATMSLVQGTTAAGAVVYNNKGNAVAQQGARTWSLYNHVTYTPFAPVYKTVTPSTPAPGDLNNGAYDAVMNVYSTDKVTADTTVVYVTQLTYDHFTAQTPSILLPREPVRAYQATPGLSADNWGNVQLPGLDPNTGAGWTAPSSQRTIGNAQHMYWEWKWVQSGWQGVSTWKIELAQFS